MSSYWGYHTMFDCGGCSIQAITSRETLTAFIKELVKEIDMVAFGEPMMEHFATHDETKAGFSFCQMIETSNITGHFVDKNGDAYIDIFSCKPYDVEVALAVVNKYLMPTKVRTNYITRQAG